VNEGVLDRATYLPVIARGWQALLAAIDDDGMLHWVQDVGSAPATTAADDTHAYGVGLFLLAASEVVELAPELVALSGRGRPTQIR
jgi:rhamnogalacturonyl hydrolase YesR